MTHTNDFPSQFDPIASAQAVATAGNARFTVLTPRLLRLDYSPIRVLTAGFYENDDGLVQ